MKTLNNAEIKNIKTSIMGTIKFDLKCKGHRGFQDFICYPINKDNELITIQSDKRIGTYNPSNGNIFLSKSRAGGSYFAHFAIDELTAVQLDGLDNQSLKMQIFMSASDKSGLKENKVMHSDNSKAINIFEL